VVTCPWRMPQVAVAQVEDMARFRASATPDLKDRYRGMVQTVWSDPDTFMEGFYARKKDPKMGRNTPWHSFRALYDRIPELVRHAAKKEKKAKRRKA
jgi:hypothetical protein